MSKLDALVERYGADPAGVVSFHGEPGPALLPYTTLTEARQRDSSGDLEALAGVYEWQHNPLMFLVDGDLLSGNEGRLGRIRRCIALRGDASYLAVIESGRLTVHKVALDRSPINRTCVELPHADRMVVPFLANARPDAALARSQWISDLILQLLRSALKQLIATGLNDSDAISLAGRALFARFLCDRDLMPTYLSESDQLDDLFDDPRRAANTSAWLDETFNGDFLPLTSGLPHDLSHAACKPLADIMRRAPEGQLYLGWEQRWDYLDFSQIPVGVLSQAYEGYLRSHRSKDQKQQSGYYTPRPIADVLVRGALTPLRSEGRSHRARILDPAVGGGVFLITAFQQLVAERWAATGARPDTQGLREVLYDQLTGFDIDEAALRFAALGLYLSAIELDPSPEPVGKLRFENLRGRVLWKMGDTDTGDQDARLGSLGPLVGPEHNGRYDIVVGNPPWTGSGRLAGWPKVARRVSQIAAERLGADHPPPPLPNEVPDLAFLWRATEWCRREGRISFAISARVLFQQGDRMPEARRAIFSALDVTGVVNGSSLRKTKVWPNISAPFCLLFARNRVPLPGSGFRFLSPRFEQTLNAAGVMRIDTSNADVVSAPLLVERPTILKTLFRGTRLDLELLQRIDTQDHPTLAQYWNHLFPPDSGRNQQTGNGYQRLRPSSRVRRNGDGLPGVSADYLKGLPDIGTGGISRLRVDVDSLNPFCLERIHDPRPRSLFDAPLALVHESPPATRRRIATTVSRKDVVYNESYYGYSTRGHPQAYRLAKYIALFLQSRFALWYSLVTSGKFGFERETIEKSTIDSIPIVPLDSLGEIGLSKLDSLFHELSLNADEEQWAALDEWVFSILGLKPRDAQTIQNTLDFNLPFAATQERAQEPANPEDFSAFCLTLKKELMPWSEPLGSALSVASVDLEEAAAPWTLLAVSAIEAGAREEPTNDSAPWTEIIRVADQTAATEIVSPDKDNGRLWIARLRQKRYWNSSQARLLAERIAWEHLDDLVGD